MATKKRKYTWKPDLPDVRDYAFKPKKTKKALPALVDLRSQFGLVYDQSQLGSCTANGTAMAVNFTCVKEGLPALLPSRLFIYYNERAIEGTIKQDSGAQIRDGVKAMATIGNCPETDWKYVISKFKTKPPKKCFTEAKNALIKQYMRLDNTKLDDLKSCLASGYGFIFGFSVYESFESDAVAQTGIVPMPKKGEKLLGGHAVFCVGYSDAKQSFIVRNSWGEGWGDKGHFFIPYQYLTNTNLSDDFWSIRVV